MKKMLFVAAAAVLALGIGAVNGCRKERHPGAEIMVDYLAEALDLSEAQRAQAEEIKAELLEKGRTLHAAHRVKAGEVKELLGADEFDPERARRLVAEHRAKIDELVDLAITRLAEFHRTLTPEQKAKLIEKLERFSRWHAPRFAPGRQG